MHSGQVLVGAFEGVLGCCKDQLLFCHAAAAGRLAFGVCLEPDAADTHAIHATSTFKILNARPSPAKIIDLRRITAPTILNLSKCILDSLNELISLTRSRAMIGANSIVGMTLMESFAVIDGTWLHIVPDHLLQH